MNNKIELLSPAANLEFGKAAIMAGADAVYIGGPGFGARRAAGNSVADIAQLARFAHGFGAKVYVAMNTILFEGEIQAARDQVYRLYENAGIDALIVQDMAFAEMELPDLALHASTQSFNLEPERVKFLADNGFSRVILERGASLDTIKKIREATDVELEAFVHGAICVAYSGQCYLGHSVCGRGGNRGACAQACRSYYNLENQKGDRLLHNSNLLSPKDMNLSDDLDRLLDAGICSLKIEGRLKELAYVVNNTAYYHQRLEQMGVERSSAGEVMIDFEPDPIKSFSRGFTTYNFDGAGVGWASGDSTRSIGEEIGTVVSIDADCAVIKGAAGVLNNGDGVCFISSTTGQNMGTRVNKVAMERVWLNSTEGLAKGVKIYRNHDHSFRPDQRSVRREVGVSIAMSWDQMLRVRLEAYDADGCRVEVVDDTQHQVARNKDMARNNLEQALYKTGGTIFYAQQVDVQQDDGDVPFVPNSVINELRRELLDKLVKARIEHHLLQTSQDLKNYRSKMQLKIGDKNISLDSLNVEAVVSLDFRANVANSLSKEFYRKRGVEVLEMAAESQKSEDFLVGKVVMTTPFCIRRELGACIMQKQFEGKTTLPQISISPNERLFLENNGARFELSFDCKLCRMQVIRR